MDKIEHTTSETLPPSVIGMDDDLAKQMIEAGLMEAPTPGTTMPAGTADLSESALDDVNAALEREALYSEQEVGADMIEPAPVDPAEGIAHAKKASAKPKREKKAGVPRVARAAAAGSPGAYVASIAKETRIELVDDLPSVDIAELIDGINAVKIREKAVNFFDHHFCGRALSVFTSLAIDHLHEGGIVNGKNLVALYRGKGYSEGTSRSQAQQIVTLLKTVGVIDAAGKEMLRSVFSHGRPFPLTDEAEAPSDTEALVESDASAEAIVS